tara:strand:- start:1212 stop:1949 length:738 start_codon:yes stop_codon:yes gene_type:complete
MDLQHISQEEFEHIEKYVNGKLDTIDLHKIEQRIQNDAEFKSKVEDIKIILTGIETQVLKEQLNMFHEDIDKKSTNSETKNTKVHTLNWKRLLVAAVLIIAAGSFWFLNGNSNERLYAEYFSPDPGLPTTMSSTDNYDFYEAMVNYKQGDYKTAISKWEILQKSKPDNDTLNYFIGVAYLANKNESIAISFLEEATKNSEFALNNDAHYYLGLAYLKQGNIEKAKANFKFSDIDNSEDLLSKLND